MGDKGRGFNWEESPHIAISEAEARLAAETIAGALGIPAGEQAASDVISRKGRHRVQGGFGPVFERERLVTIERLVNGYMVAGSIFRVAISNQGRPARLLVKWPRFVMPEDLTLRARNQVVQIVASQLWDAFSGAELDLGFNLGYARYGFRYLPVVFVGASDTISRTHLAVPVVITPPDRDADGIPDAADNCLENHDLYGEDSDADGVGDRCDNCPTLPNADQFDADGDGTGDACEMPEGACALPDTTCERLSHEACVLEQGAYAGDGTDCAPDVPASVDPVSGPRLEAVLVHPNPFARTVQIAYDLGRNGAGVVRIEVYDTGGRLVRSLASESANEGRGKLLWDGRDASSRELPNGMYFIRLCDGSKDVMTRVTLLK